MRPSGTNHMNKQRKRSLAADGQVTNAGEAVDTLLMDGNTSGQMLHENRKLYSLAASPQNHSLIIKQN